jgi:hypothetical protein
MNGTRIRVSSISSSQRSHQPVKKKKNRATKTFIKLVTEIPLREPGCAE